MSRRYPNKYIIGLTGNIAVGKSLVLRMLRDLGADAIDADQVAHQTMMPDKPAWQAIVKTFGEDILDRDRQINRTDLGKIVFADPAALKQLESITHPLIRQTIDRLIRASTKNIIVIEAIKLLEGRLKDAVDAVWVVDAAPQTQLQRLIASRNLSQAQAQQRIRAQNSQADKIRQADVVIRNNGDPADALKQVQTHWTRIQKTLNK